MSPTSPAGPPAKPLDVPAAVRLVNATLWQWRDALRQGLDVAQYRAVLLADLDRAAEAMGVISDWCPS